MVCLETNLYDLASQKLVWTGQTQTWVDKSADENVRQVIYAVLWDLRAKKVI